LIVVSYCMPGSPQTQAASAIVFMSSRALKVPIGCFVVRATVVHSPSASTAFMKGSVTRTEWLAFWYAIES
jgi:hypothetical protein